jgi:ligand-binding sensor domain-containing protein
MRPSKYVLLVAIAAALLLAVTFFVFFSAQRALTRSAEDTLAGQRLGFSLRDIDLATVARPAFEPVAAPVSFTSGASLDRDVYLAGPAGLSVYAQDGALRRALRSGVELPVEAITAVATARLRGSSESEVLLATSGAGLLLLQPSRTGAPKLRQLLSERADERDLTALLPLPSGDLLLGTRHAGVLLWNGATLSPLRFDLPGGNINPATLEVTALAAADAASFLIGTRNAGLFYDHAGTVQHTDTGDGLPDRQIESLLIVNQKLYAGTPLGIAEFDLTADVFRPQRTLAHGLFSHTLAYDPTTRQLDVGTLDQSIQQVALSAAPRLRNASIVAPRDVAPANEGERIDAFLTPSGPGAPLFAIADGKLLRSNGANWAPALEAPTASLADRNLSALAFAPDGSLYAGFFDHGLDILSPDGNSVRHLEDDHLFCINRLVLDPVRQTIAAATANGLVLFDRQGTPRQVLTRRDGLISDHVTDLAFTSEGMTIATPAGLTFAGPDGMASLYAFEGLVNNHVYALASAGNGRILAGTLGGISLLESGAVKRNLTVTNSGLKHNWVTAIVPFQNGYLVGTYGAGIQQLASDGSFRAIDLPAGVPGDLILNPNAIFISGNYVYAGTLDHGMLVYSGATGRWFSVTRGLPSRNVTAFAERNGELYIGTENGLVRIAESRLEAQLQ